MRVLYRQDIHPQNPLFFAIRAIYLIEAHLTSSRKDGKLSSLINLATRQNFDMESLNFLQPHVTFCVDWDSLMAKQNHKPDFNLIDYRLNDAELEAYEKLLEKEVPSFSRLLADFAEKDYKISFSFVENSAAWCCSVTGKPDAKFNSSSTLTTWSDDAMDALAMAHFKVFTVFSGGVWKTKEQSRRG